MRLSIITPVLDSHEVVRRQVWHYERMDIPDGVEIIYVDDGSDPPLRLEYSCYSEIIQIYETHDLRPWTWPIARNKGAGIATGKNLFMVDIDYILTKEVITAAAEFQGDRMDFVRQFGILDKDGRLQTDKDTMLLYGLKEKHLASTNFWKGHRNNFVMNADIYAMIGGYNETICHRQADNLIDGPDSSFKRVWNRFVRTGAVTPYEGYKPTLYMFPNGRFCHTDKGLFHNL